MPDSSGFVDLRVGHGAQGVGDDSVWPSFTDIMTVIVMIFLMALVVIMVRNFELDRQLLSTITAKDQTALANQGLVDKVTSLEGSLGDTETQRDLLQVNLVAETERLAALSSDQELLKVELQDLIKKRQQLVQDNSQLQLAQQDALAEIAELIDNEQSQTQQIETLTQQIEILSKQFETLQFETTDEIESLSSAKQLLHEKLDVVAIQLAQVKSLLQQSRTENQTLAEDVTELDELKQDFEQRYTLASEEIQALKELIRLRERENEALQLEAQASGSQYRSLQEEYESLDSRYRDLIRPARSTAGKYVVQVWVEKSGTGLSYQLKLPEQGERTAVSRAQLDETLQGLKERFGGELYTKIVIPENSQLSHNEAWKFTQEILQKFDYYHQ